MKRRLLPEPVPRSALRCSSPADALEVDGADRHLAPDLGELALEVRAPQALPCDPWLREQQDSEVDIVEGCAPRRGQSNDGGVLREKVASHDCLVRPLAAGASEDLVIDQIRKAKVDGRLAEDILK